MRRVVVTGMGIVSSIGNTTQEVLASLHDAKSGIRKAESYAELGFRCQVHGAPKDLDVTALVGQIEHPIAGQHGRPRPPRTGPGRPDAAGI